MNLMCRFCFATDGILEPIFGNKNSLILNEMATLNNILLFKLRNIQGWPFGICLDCKSKLIATHNFINCYLRSQKLLLEQFGSSSKTSTFDEGSENDESSHFGPMSDGYMLQLDDEFSRSTESLDDPPDIEIPQSTESVLGNPPDVNHTELIPIEKKCIKCHCGKICKTQKSLLLHQRVHLSEKPFKCEYCPENFKFKLNAFWHVNKVHKRTCKKCGRLFQTPKGLKMHHKLNSGH